MSVYVVEGPAYRIGMIAGRRVGIAVQRNRARRLLREAMRLLRPRLRDERPAAILLSARPEIASATIRDVVAELESLLAARGLLAGKP
jgi:ribonuclease P protein component